MMKIATNIRKIQELIEAKFTPDQIRRADYFLEGKALKLRVPYMTYLRRVSQCEELSATARLLAMYLIYVFR